MEAAGFEAEEEGTEEGNRGRDHDEVGFDPEVGVSGR